MDRWEMGSLARLWSSGFPLYRFFRGSCPSFPIKPVLPGVRGADLKKYVIHGGRPLYGKVEVSGAKNAAVGIIPAALLVEGVWCCVWMVLALTAAGIAGAIYSWYAAKTTTEG